MAEKAIVDRAGIAQDVDEQPGGIECRGGIVSPQVFRFAIAHGSAWSGFSEQRSHEAGTASPGRGERFAARAERMRGVSRPNAPAERSHVALSENRAKRRWAGAPGRGNAIARYQCARDKIDKCAAEFRAARFDGRERDQREG